MGKCQSCGAEGVALSVLVVRRGNYCPLEGEKYYITGGETREYSFLDVCVRCYAQIKRDVAERRFYETQLEKLAAQNDEM